MDPNKLKPQAGEDSTQNNFRTNEDVQAVLETLSYLEGQPSVVDWLRSLVGSTIEAEAPALRELLADKRHITRFEDTLESLDRLCPAEVTETSVPKT